MPLPLALEQSARCVLVPASPISCWPAPVVPQPPGWQHCRPQTHPSTGGWASPAAWPAPTQCWTGPAGTNYSRLCWPLQSCLTRCCCCCPGPGAWHAAHGAAAAGVAAAAAAQQLAAACVSAALAGTQSAKVWEGPAGMQTTTTAGYVINNMWSCDVCGLAAPEQANTQPTFNALLLQLPQSSRQGIHMTTEPAGAQLDHSLDTVCW